MHAKKLVVGKSYTIDFGYGPVHATVVSKDEDLVYLVDSSQYSSFGSSHLLSPDFILEISDTTTYIRAGKAKSVKRKSVKRKSVKRKSVKRKSVKRKSVKRKSVKRKSVKRKSVKRKSVKRKSAKRKSAKRKSVKRKSN